MGEGRQGVLMHTELEEAKLNAAFCELALEESYEDTKDVKAVCDAADERLMKRLRREYRRIRLGAAMKKTARQTAKAAVFLIITAAVAGGMAVAGDGLLRGKIFEIVVDYTNSDKRIEMYSNNLGEIELPDGWWAPYYHSYVPEGFELIDEDVNAFSCYQNYRNGENGFWISYDRGRSSNTIVFTEGSEIAYEQIGDNMVTVLTREENNYTVFWHEGDIRIMAHLWMPYDEAMKIVEGIVPISIEAFSTDN